ncbi:MAG: EF-hand domain-containing protein [Planctomycetota bacterium]
MRTNNVQLFSTGLAMIIVLSWSASSFAGPGKKGKRGPADDGPPCFREGAGFTDDVGFGKNRPDRPGKRGHRHAGQWGAAHRGEGHRRGGPNGRILGTFRHLEVLQGDEPPAHFNLDRYAEADTDGDETLSAEEWRAFADEKIERILNRLLERMPGADTNGDEALDAEELEALKAIFERRAREDVLLHHPEADTDGDGVISIEEFEAFAEERQEQRRARILENHPEADLDGDGVLSDEEMQSFHPRRGDGQRWGMNRRGGGRR